MTHTTEQERAAYERELIDNHHYVPSDFSFKDGFYGGDDDYIQFGWDLWQAARRAPAVPETIEQRAKKLKGLQVLTGATAGVPEAIAVARSRFVEAYGRSPLHDDLAYACLLIDAYGGAPAVPVPQETCVICGSDEPYTGTCGSNDPRALCKKPAPQPPEAEEEEPLQEQLDEALQSLEFYKRRCDLLQSIQPRMRDPERTMVCDVLANGHLLQSGDGQPDKARYAPPEAAPVQLPEPAVPYAIFDCHGFYETRATKAAAQSFCDHYNKRDADGGGSAPYTVQALYTEHQVRQLLAAHGIKEQST